MSGVIRDPRGEARGACLTAGGGAMAGLGICAHMSVCRNGREGVSRNEP